MTENSKIEWCDHSFNGWIGCTAVGPGCDHCYAEALAARFNWAEWGTGKQRLLTSDSNWRLPYRWNRQALKKLGRPARVFSNSLSDVFDNEVDPAWRARLFHTIKATPNLQWLLLTKRIGNVPKMLPRNWRDGYPNVVMMATVVNQEEADRDIPKLLEVPARWRGLSIEPMLGPVTIFDMDGPVDVPDSLPSPIHQVICGGESGPHARPMHPDWARSLRDQCQVAGVPFFFKQWGAWAPNAAGVGHDFVGKKGAGRSLDGREWNGFPSQQETS